jgi:hypothetical protein
MTPPPDLGTPRPRRPRLHWPTAVLLTLAAGGFLWLNVRTTKIEDVMMMDRGRPDEVDPVTYRLFYRGWPLSPCMYCGTRGMQWDPRNGGGGQDALLFDALLALGVLAGVAFACEWCIARLKAWRAR